MSTTKTTPRRRETTQPDATETTTTPTPHPHHGRALDWKRRPDRAAPSVSNPRFDPTKYPALPR